ncbi:c-type cytochrome [Thiobacillus sedimenti]|uniref:C-type cytochrome n=1 Tax=Thiobacillus sedimenti TaxID=3110231 RepID=A0ABZ1CMC0_9PROT|nr:c-type cytochrome [Thiobacillus sp. SCUT-2]WRS40546.1 c-type cytochrome [Thiobacillus sp. SCUT-2]
MKKTSLVLALSLAALLGACGKQESPPAEAPAPAPQAAAPAAPEAAAPAAPEAAAPAAAAAEPKAEGSDDVGKKVFGAVCSMCHASGAAGAPKFGNKEEWGPRIAQGKDVLYKHALEGFTGSKGMMPARGGSATLKDDEVKAAVDYMVHKAQE